MNWRVLIPPSVITLGFLSVLFILWHEEFQYYLPVPGHSDLPTNKKLSLEFLKGSTKPTYIHFFSEECRNSRINLAHIPRIIQKHEDQVNFYIIHSGRASEKELRNTYELPAAVNLIKDHDGQIAARLQVISAPYALVLTEDQLLFFGGNYNNKNGLCGANEINNSSPAIALDFLLKQNNPPLFPVYQINFSGCRLNQS